MHTESFLIKLGFIPNDSKIERTINRTLRNTYFLLQLDFPYELTLSSFTYDVFTKKISIQSSSNFEILKELYLLDAQIRHVDDYIDNTLRKKRDSQVKIDEAIINFEKQFPIAKDVAKLFKLESKIMVNLPKNPKKLIADATNVRPADFFALANFLTKTFKSKLSHKDFAKARLFYEQYHMFRDIIDDIISVDDDTINNNYNVVIQAKRNKLNQNFVQELAMEKLRKMKKLIKSFSKKVDVNNYSNLIDFWEKEYYLMFKPLLHSYYTNLDNFRKIYFYVK